MCKAQDKISNELRELLNSDRKPEKISICIWLRDESTKKIYKELIENGYDIESYSSIDNFEKVRVPQLIKKIGENRAYNVSNESDNQTERNIDIAIREDIYNYYKRFIKAAEIFFSFSNGETIFKILDEYEFEIIYNCKLIPLVIVKVDNQSLYKIIENDKVERISIFHNYEVENEMDIAEQQVKSYDVKKKDYLTQYGYKGRNVNVGIIDSKNGIEEHADAVMYEIAGKCTVEDGIPYEGVAPCASLVCKKICDEKEFLSAIEELIKKNIHIINMSAGIKSEEEYSNIDKVVDKLLYKYKVNFIKSAGNKEKITAPGMAWNSLVVGNIETKEKLGTRVAYKSEPYVMRMNSGYKHPSYLANKPDISAPGTELYIPKIGVRTGTSYAAPLVTGVVAQIIEANPKLLLNPNMIKSILMLSANSNIIDDDAIADAVFLKERSGAGMLNALEAIKLCENLNLNFKEYTISLDGTTSKEIFVDLNKLKKGNRLEGILVYDKAEDFCIDGTHYLASDLDIYLENSRKEICEKSISYNNIEIIKKFISETDKYYFRIKPFYLNNTNDNRYINVSLLWKII